MKKPYNFFLLYSLCVAVLIATQAVQAQQGPFVWTQSLSNNARVYAIAIHPTNPSIIYAAGLDSGVYKTTNTGVTWFAVNNGLTYNKILSMAISPSNPNVLYAGTDQLGGANSGVYITSNAGGTWAFASNGITDSRGIQAITVNPTDPNTAIIGVFDGLVNSTIGLYKTTNAGGVWSASNNGVGTIKNFLSLAINPRNGNTIYAGTSFNVTASMGPSKVYKSIDGGANWLLANAGLPKDSTTIDPVRALSVSTADTSVILAGLFVNDTAGGAFLSTNGGASWAKRHTGLPAVTGTLLRSCLIRPGSVTEFFVGLDGGGTTSRGVWRTTNGGNSWVDFNGGSLVNTYTVRAFAFRTQADSTLYAGAASTAPPGQGVFDYTWALTGVRENEARGIPQQFAVMQNYPNPFNPTTTIRYALPGKSLVTLTVYNTLGQRVAQLLNEQQEAGYHEVVFRGEGLASGVYLYRVETDGAAQTRKLLLLK